MTPFEVRIKRQASYSWDKSLLSAASQNNRQGEQLSGQLGENPQAWRELCVHQGGRRGISKADLSGFET